MLEIFGSVKDNIINRIKNPFLGTFSIVFVLKNWQLFYSLFIFGHETREAKISIIEGYITQSNFWGVTGAWAMFIQSIVYTIVVLLLSGLLSNLGIFIANGYDARLKTWILKIVTDGRSTYTKDEFEVEKKRADNLEKRLDEERSKRIAIEGERDTLQKDLEKQLTEVRKKDILQKDLNKLLTEEDERDTLQKDLEKSREERIVDRLFENGWVPEFNDLISQIASNSPYISTSRLEEAFYSYIITQNIIVEDSKRSRYYILTDFGNKVRELFADRTT